MSKIEDFKERYDVGLEILRELFKLDKTELRNKIKEICGDQIPNQNLFVDGTVEKVISDDDPKSISIYFYDSIQISPFGIGYKPEMGNYREIVPFNKFFDLK